jgi:2-oxo-hept-3-ene-1,7-dioate hydratase
VNVSNGATLTPADVAAIAAAHEHARRSAVSIRRPTLAHPQMTIDDAYACQQAWVDQQIADGAVVMGHKIGLTSRAMQQAVNIDEPDFGTLLDYMFIDDGAQIPIGGYLDPKLEVEIAFVLGDRLYGADVTVDDVRAVTDYVMPALELIDARSYRTDPDDGVTRTVFDTIADNAANAGIICGTKHTVLKGIDLRWVGAIMKRNGMVEETGLAAGVMDDPMLGIVWLARRLAPYGIGLEAGETILAGSFTRPVACRAGDQFHVDFGSFGKIECSFV